VVQNAILGQGFKMRIKSFNSGSKCHSGAWDSKCELNHSIVVQNGITKHVIQNAILGHRVQNVLKDPIIMLHCGSVSLYRN
jgi:hypothetical protein